MNEWKDEYSKYIRKVCCYTIWSKTFQLWEFFFIILYYDLIETQLYLCEILTCYSFFPSVFFRWLKLMCLVSFLMNSEQSCEDPDEALQLKVVLLSP